MRNPWDWAEADILAMMKDQVQEHLMLDYKAADALGIADGKKSEIAKDVSAFANSAGGTLIYGRVDIPLTQQATICRFEGWRTFRGRSRSLTNGWRRKRRVGRTSKSYDGRTDSDALVARLVSECWYA